MGARRQYYDSKAEMVPDALQGCDYVQASNDHASLAKMDMQS
jgi:hypothetical protein